MEIKAMREGEFDIYFVNGDVVSQNNRNLELLFDQTFTIDETILDQIALYLSRKGNYCKFRINWDDLTYDAGFGAIVEALRISDIARPFNARWHTIGYIPRKAAEYFTLKLGERDLLDILAESVTVDTKFGSPSVAIKAVYQGETLYVCESEHDTRAVNSHNAVTKACRQISEAITLCIGSDSFDRIIKEQMTQPNYLLAYMLCGGTDVGGLHKAICNLKD